MPPKASTRKRVASGSVPNGSNGTPTKASRSSRAATSASRAATPSTPAPKKTLASALQANGTPAGSSSRAGSLAPGTPSKRRTGPPVYAVRTGINELPLPVKPLVLADIASGLPIGQPTLSQSSSASPASQDILPRGLYVFGNGDMGQFGLGTDAIDEIKRPRKHIWVEDKILKGELGEGGFEQIAAGGMHTLAIDSEGKIWSWGINDNAALGRETGRGDVEAEVLETEPMLVEGLGPQGKGTRAGTKEQGGGQAGDVETFRATRIAAGDSVSVALSEDGQVRVWGSFRSNDGLLGFDGRVGSSKTQYSPVALPTLLQHSFSQIVCGDDHVLALTTSGIVFSWGNGQQAQLGRRIIERRKINGLNPEKVGVKDVVLIGSGAYHSFAVDKKGEVYGWGLNSLQQVGIDSEEDIIPSPRRLPALSPKKLSADGSVKVVAIAAGQHHSLFLLSDGRVFGCGRCDGCELGLDSSHPAMLAVKELREAWRTKREQELQVEMAAFQKRMEEKNAANGGQTVSMGDAVSSENMPPVMGPPPDEFIAEPIEIPFPNNAKIASLSAGARFNLATSTEGILFSWGFGNQSQLGLGDEESAETPTEVKSKQWRGHKGVAVSAGGQHSTVLAVRDPRVQVE